MDIVQGIAYLVLAVTCCKGDSWVLADSARRTKSRQSPMFLPNRLRNKASNSIWPPAGENSKDWRAGMQRWGRESTGHFKAGVLARECRLPGGWYVIAFNENTHLGGSRRNLEVALGCPKSELWRMTTGAATLPSGAASELLCPETRWC